MLNNAAQDLNEESLLALLEEVRRPISRKPDRIVVSEEGLAWVIARCEEDPEFRRMVLAEFPQFEGIL